MIKIEEDGTLAYDDSVVCASCMGSPKYVVEFNSINGFSQVYLCHECLCDLYFEAEGAIY